jgi:hypothetical protein
MDSKERKMVSDEIKEIVLRDRETRLSISRVPKKTREEFINFAKEEFEGDYGMLLKDLWEKYKKSFSYENLNNKLDYIIQLLKNSNEKEEKSITAFSGRVMKGGGEENGKS